jgi:hypothetical protein
MESLKLMDADPWEVIAMLEWSVPIYLRGADFLTSMHSALG